MPLRMNSAIASFNFLCSCTARIFTSRISSSGRSSVVFTGARFPEIWFSVKLPGSPSSSPVLRRHLALWRSPVRPDLTHERESASSRGNRRPWHRLRSGKNYRLHIMSTSEIFLVAMVIIFTVPYLVWRLFRTEYYAPLVGYRSSAASSSDRACWARSFPIITGSFSIRRSLAS